MTPEGQTAKLAGGGRAGNVATTIHWNVTVAFILKDLVPSWIARGFGFYVGEACLLILVWADDFTLVASSVSELHVMVTELAHAMSLHGVQLKESKCKWLANANALENTTDGVADMLTTGFGHEESLVILGVLLTQDADAQASADFAISRAQRHWFQRSKQLCRRRVPISKRILWYYATVGATALFGQEALPLTQKTLRAFQSFDRRCLHAILGIKKDCNMGWTAFRRRQNTKLRAIFLKMGIGELSVRLLAKQHAWAGHVSRLDVAHIAGAWSRVGTAQDWLFTQAALGRLDSQNSQKWRHPRRGRLATSWETWLVRAIGDDWRHLALDRAKWRESRELFLKSALTLIFGEGHRNFGMHIPAPP